MAALFQPINESGVSGMATILVAETLESRRYLARQMMIAALLSQGTVVVLTLILAFALLKRVLKPMRKLSGIMLRRDPGELTPLPRVLPWSEMQPLLVAFNRYIERLRLMVARQERFSADASHQLRTPLAVLKTQVGVALASDRPQQWRESLQAMSTTLDNTVALTDRLLHLSRLKASEHQAERQLHPVNLAQVLRDACFSRRRRRAVNRSISGLKARRRARWRGTAAVGRTVRQPAGQRAEIHAAPGRGDRAPHSGSGVREGVLEIEDSGPGIALQDKALALQPFHRLDNVGDQPGAGLGLALVKDITAYHGTRPELLSSAALGGLLVRVRFRLLP